MHNYPYYDPATNGLDFAAMVAALASSQREPSSSCTRVATTRPAWTRSPKQWERIIEVVTRAWLVPFLDLAYQGFADGIDADGAVVRRSRPPPARRFAPSSFSKSLSLYGERVGAFSIVADERDVTARMLSQLKRMIRTNYSNPPTHGGKIVTWC